MRRLVVLVMLLLAAPSAAPAQTGWKPLSFRHNDGARDMREGRGPDRWIITVVDPRGRATLQVYAGGGESTVDLDMNQRTSSKWTVERRSLRVDRPGFRRVPFPGSNQNAGHVDLRRVRGGWRLTGRAAFAYELDLTIRSNGPGPTMVSRYPEGWGLLRRAIPVMDGVATGRLRQGDPLGKPERIRGWRTTIVHDWWVPSDRCCPPSPEAGYPYPRCCADTDVAMIYGAGGTTGVIGGWTMTSPADDKGGWSGVIARRRGGRLSWCRATRERIVHRLASSHALEQESMVVTGCGPRIRFRAIGNRPHDRFDGFLGRRRTRNTLWFHQEYHPPTGPIE